MSERVELRALVKADLGQLVALCREHAAFERARWQEHERETGLEAELLGEGSARCWVVDAGHELGGFATVSMELSTWDAQRYLHLDCLFLRPAYRGRGLGRELFQQVARFALEHGAVNVQWQTPSWNVDAVRFYDRLGSTSTPKLRLSLSPDDCKKLLARSSSLGDPSS